MRAGSAGGVAIRLRAYGLVLRFPLHLDPQHMEVLKRLPVGPHDALLWIERSRRR